MSGDVCGVGWYDGQKGHVCRTVGPHEKHKCRHCPAVLAEPKPTTPEVKTT